jgi:cytochrome c551/c552
VTISTDFLAWAKGQQKKVATPSGGASGKAAFSANGCNTCHTFTPAGANKKIGPDLDKLPAEAQRAGKPLDEFIRESIVDPNAYVEPGYPKNVMPNFNLTQAQVDSLVQFLVASAKKGSS